MRLLVINNKSSGRGDSSIYDFIRSIGEAGDEIVIRNLGGGRSLEEQLADARDFDIVVASGGDGTVTSICYELRYSGVPVVPFPSGTGNLLNMNLNAPEEPREIANMVKAHHVENYDLGEMTFCNSEGKAQSVGFSIIAGAGFDASIMENAQGLKSVLGQSAYYMSALVGSKLVKSDIEINVDGKTINTSGVGVMVVNFAKIASNISITHVNDARDGLLEVVVITPDSKIGMTPALFAAALDVRGQYPSRGNVLEIHAGKKIEVSCNPPLPIQYDGEVPGATTPFTATCLPGALTTLVDDMELERLREIREMDEESDKAEAASSAKAEATDDDSAESDEQETDGSGSRRAERAESAVRRARARKR